MMKYKVGDKIKFVKDYTVGTGEVIPANSVWEVKSVLSAHYRLECADIQFGLMIEQKLADDNCEKINEAPSIVKRINDKHNILNGMIEGLAEDEHTEPLLQEVSLGKLYTWQDLCDYEILLHERWRIANEQRMEQGQELSVMHTLRQEYMDAIERAMAKLGRDVPASKAKELGFEV